MNILDTWARDWAISPVALRDLRVRLGAEADPDIVAAPSADLSEAGVQSRVRVAARRDGAHLWRNNVGVFHDVERGVFVRFGLCNDSKQLNERVKSADLIGIRPRVIQPQDVGTLIGQFVSRECKHGGWKWTGSDREVAQQNWAALINSLGGDASFVSHG